MTPIEFYKQLAVTTEQVTLTLSPGPLELRGSPQDALSAELMLWLIERLPDATQGDVEEVLVNALWWWRFWGALHYANTRPAQQQEMEL